MPRCNIPLVQVLQRGGVLLLRLLRWLVFVIRDTLLPLLKTDFVLTASGLDEGRLAGACQAATRFDPWDRVVVPVLRLAGSVEHQRRVELTNLVICTSV